MCYYCKASKQALVQTFSDKISSLSVNQPASQPVPVTLNQHQTTTEPPAPKMKPNPAKTKPTNKSQVLVTERNLNVVIYGTDENSLKTPRTTRFKNDLEKILPIFSTVDCSIQATLIRDIQIYIVWGNSRPILVKFLRSIDVNNILSNRNLISSPIVVKPDMTKEERGIESKLLSQCWNLIQEGIDQKSIKIRRNQLFVNNQPHGQIIRKF